MKTRTHLLLLIFVLSVACSNQSNGSKENTLNAESLTSPIDSNDSINPSNYPDSLRHYIDKANRLKRFYKSVSSNPNETAKYEKLFFEEFPADFKTFEIIYCNGMFDYDLQNLLITESEDHIHYLLYGIKSINTENIYTKVINLVNDGKWDPDDALQEQLLELVIRNPSLIFSVLEKRNDEVVKNFFIYLFNGPHPLEKLPQEFYDSQKEYTRIVSLAEEGLKKTQLSE